jgi:hypothetical protein
MDLDVDPLSSETASLRNYMHTQTRAREQVRESRVRDMTVSPPVSNTHFLSILSNP